MVEKMSGSSDSGHNYNSRATTALNKRADSIKNWKKSETAKEKPIRLPKQFTIKFDKGTVFLSAVASGDLEETSKLLDEGVDIDYTNVDGLTALHQACIDENDEMVNLLLDRGANIEARDNEGWTPLHAAASAGNVEIAQILIDNNADLAAVNNEGEVPLDLAEEEEMEDFLSEEIDNQGLEVDDARNEEERQMIEDANSWLNKKKVDETLDWQGATSLHVAAAKGYNKVISLLLQIGTIDVNIRDNDGWTALHAAVHWGSKSACELLTDAGADFELRNNNGQTPCDLAEPEFVKTAEACRKKSKDLAKKPNFTKNKRIDITIDVNENSLHGKESNGIENLKKAPIRSIVKGSRANSLQNLNEITNDSSNNVTNDNKSGSGSGSGESDHDSDAENKPNSKRPSTAPASVDTSSSRTVSQNNNPLRPSSLLNKVEDKTKDNKPETTSVSSRLGSRYKKEENEEPKKEELAARPSRFTISNRPYSARTTTDTKTEVKKEEDRISSRFNSKPSVTKVEKSEDTTTNRFKSRIRPDDEKKQDKPINGPNARTFLGPSRPSGFGDWRTRLAERTKDADNDESNISRPNKAAISVTETSKTAPLSTTEASESSSESDSGEDSDSNKKEGKNERISPHSRRVAHRNLRETRRSTGVVYLPEEDESESSEPDNKRSTDASDTRRSRVTSNEDDTSRMSIAERLRRKNQELLSSSDRTTERTSLTDRTSTADRFSSSRDSTSSVTSSVRDRTSNRVTSTSSTDTGDTKDIQRKLDQALKEVQDYKQKYEKMKKEKEDLAKQLEQYKEDIDKMQDLKNDNLRLKDENGALIRVISKLSRTPAS